MAKLLSHQLIQQSIYATPNPSSLSPATHFCKDCGVMFESSTSLEVHLSYHKENLLSRWANQDNLDKSSSSSGSSGSNFVSPPHPQPESSELSQEMLQVNPSSPSPGKRDSSSVDSNPGQYFQPDLPPPPPQQSYITPLYNNNTGDQHHPLQSPSYRQTSNAFLVQPPPTQTTVIADMNGGGYEFHHNPYHHSPYLPPHQNINIFSPGGQGNGLPSHLPPLLPPQQRDPKEPAEILDLDSHKVHVYQHPPPPQGFPHLHRPYMSPAANNGWGQPHPEEQAGFPRFSQPGFPPESPHGPTTNANNGTVFFGSSNPAEGNNIHPASFRGEEEQRGFNSQRQPSPQGVPFSHASPMPFQQAQLPANLLPPNGISGMSLGNINKHEVDHPASPATVSNKGKGQGQGQRSPGSEGDVKGSGGKTKGWKGGECKRPKTYNCPACNKWFTSSGHLKRHYGTTLHKNSMKQLGDGAEELFKNQPKRRGGKAANPDAPPKTPKGSKKGRTSPKSSEEEGMMKDGPEAHSPMEFQQHQHQIDFPQANGNHHHPPQISPSSFPTFQAYGQQQENEHHIQFQQQQPQQLPPQPPQPNFGGGHGQGHMLDFHIPVSQPAPFYPQMEERNPHLPLPPFSTVGHSHYRDHNEGKSPFQSLQQVTTLALLQQQQSGQPSAPQQQQGSPEEGGGGSDGGSGGEEGGSSSLMMMMDSSEEESSSSPAGSSGDSACSSSSTSGRKKPASADKEVHECPLCSKTFNRSCYFKQHFKQQHSNSHSGGELHKCPTCGKRFPDPDVLSEHLAKHGSEKPYKCELCPKQFNHKTDLNRHHLLHTGDRPFTCDQCGKGFIRKDHMTKHTETHRKKPSSNSNSTSSSSNSATANAIIISNPQ